MNNKEEKKINIQPQEITEEMKEAYISYAMSVIVQRALPDVRDGLKPVHRRILFAMEEMGLSHSAKFTKCAGIVGDVLKKYHPHGDMAVYDSIVGMAQNFSRRYPLIDGQGNFGSIDGDSAAAYRYTEARMTKIAEELLVDIGKETVDFRDNYDGTRKEPKVLPAKIPHLLLNGTTGIAVGMSTVIPPHNLSEVVDALVFLNENPKATNEDLTNFVKGPDFPTGGIIFNQKEIVQAYASGKGPILIRGVSEIVEKKEGQYQIIITEIPYQVNKSSLVETMADLVRDKKLEGIKDIRDESDREGMRIVIDLKTDAHPQKIQNFLFKHTDLQKSIHMNMLALVDNGTQPQVLSLKSVLELFLAHRNEVVIRRARFDLARAKERAHILEGLKKALDNIDAIIKIIKSSIDRQTAHQNLVKKFKLTDIQASAILDMRLQSLAGLERKKIEDELKEKKIIIAELETLLKSPKKISDLIKKELAEIKEKYGGPRKTKLISGAAREISEEELIPDEETIITLTRGGYIKRMNPSIYRVQHRGGKGVSGMAVKEEDVVEHLITANTHDNLLFFTDAGKVYQTKAYEIPEASRIAKGRSIFNFLSLSQDEKITSILNYKEGEKEFKYLVMETRDGIIKKAEIKDFSQVRRSGLIAIKLKKNDLLKWVHPSKGQDEIILVTKLGQAVRFSEKDLRPMGRTASGVRGIRLKKDDLVVGMDIIESEKLKSKSENLQLLIITENGFGKKTGIKEYKKQKRGGSGIKTAKITSKNGNIIASKILKGEEEDLIAIATKGQVIRTSLKSIADLGRATQGVRIMKLDGGDKIASVAVV